MYIFGVFVFHLNFTLFICM